MGETSEMVERICRDFCRRLRLDPDKMVEDSHCDLWAGIVPQWLDVKPEVERALALRAAIDAALPSPTEPG